MVISPEIRLNPRIISRTPLSIFGSAGAYELTIRLGLGKIHLELVRIFILGGTNMSSPQNSPLKDAFRSAEQLQGQIFNKAAYDPKFRAALLANPKEAITTEFEVHLPESYEITIHESEGNSLHVAIPPNYSDLSDQDLEAISGSGHNADL